MANSLYPPVVDTYTPSFITSMKKVKIDGEEKKLRRGFCKIYFSLSPYNVKEDIGSIWISMVNPKTNKSVLKNSTEVLKIKAENMHLDPSSSETNPRYYIQFGAGSVKDDRWYLNTTYKVQVRFCEKNIDNDSSSINSNIDYFSEWSTATLVRPVAGYETTIKSFKWQSDSTENIFNVYQNYIAGKVSYLDSDDYGEYLESFRIKVYTANATWKKQSLVYDSGVCYTDELEPKTFKHYFTKGFPEGKYIFSMTFTSNNLFTYTENYKVTATDTMKGTLRPKITAIPEPKNGRIKLEINISAGKEYAGNFVIRRASSETNFTHWEDLKILQLKIPKGKSHQLEWYDYTADSGIFYQYYLTRFYKNTDYRYSSFSEPVMMFLEDIFINGGGRQLKIQFDPSISSYQHTLLESSTQTIGGKYPFIKRNGNLNYRQIGISGLITYQMDILEGYGIIEDSLERELDWIPNEKNLFTSKTSLLNGYDLAYDNFNKENNISTYEDFILERKFREAVTDFLLDGKPKLFRSPTEKAAIVRLMNISTSPQDGARMRYSFSATAHEVADYDLKNISDYEIEKLGEYTPVAKEDFTIQSTEIKKSQKGLVDYFEEQDDNMINLLAGNNFNLEDSTHWKKNFKYAINTKISLCKSDYATSADPYYINLNGIEPILSTEEDSDLQGFILYYKEYEPNTIPITKAITIEGNEYTFSTDTPLSFLSFAVPAGKTIYAKVTTDAVAYETSIDDSFTED